MSNGDGAMGDEVMRDSACTGVVFLTVYDAFPVCRWPCAYGVGLDLCGSLCRGMLWADLASVLSMLGQVFPSLAVSGPCAVSLCVIGVESPGRVVCCIAVSRGSAVRGLEAWCTGVVEGLCLSCA